MIVDSTLRSYASILFSDRRLIGAIALAATFFNWRAGVFGLVALLAANALAMLLGVHEDKIKKGLIGFNALLLGLSFSYYYALAPTTFIILLVAVAFLVFVNIVLDHIFGYFFNLPALSIPFVIVSSISYLAFYNYYGALLQKNPALPIDAFFPDFNLYVSYYFRSLGAIFFQSSPWAGLMIMVALLISSRLAFLLSLLGFASGAIFHTALKGDLNDMTGGLVAFNYILTCIAVGGIFLVPGPRVFAIAIVATLATATVASFIKIFFVTFNMPVLTLPFALVTLTVIYAIKLVQNPKIRPVDFLPGSPEHNLEYFSSRQGRFGESGLDIRLPYLGKWKVSQGYHGKHTHRDLWYASLDFMAVGGEEANAVRKNQSSDIEDYYTFGLPVLATASGTVRRVVAHVEDNAAGEMNLKDNWGNLVLIQHAPLLFSMVCHLKKNSIVVKEGDHVVAGARLASAGNSGRSDIPHIHLHFQATPEIGSATIPIPFTQFAATNGTQKTRFNSVPNENEIVMNLTNDFNLKSFFSLAPGQEFLICVEEPSGHKIEELWQIRVDFLGSRYIESSSGDKLVYTQANDWFACLDYSGRKSGGLYMTYLAYYRVPFTTTQQLFSERISYKTFTSLPMRIVKDILLPFTSRVALEWQASCGDGKIASKIPGVAETQTNLMGAFPGTIDATVKGKSWRISRK